VGLGAAALRPRDPRAGTLALSFVLGFVGMVITVETPNLQRMATATPPLALATALMLDELVRRAQALFRDERARRRAVGWATAACTAALAVMLVVEVRFYFVDYARMNMWSGTTQEGRALTLLPKGTLSTSLGESFHMLQSGWVRLLAPEANRAGVFSPGAHLPLPEDGSRGLSFTIYPEQQTYVPWVRSLYPAAETVDYRLEGEEFYFTLLYVPAEELMAGRGAIASTGGVSATVASPGLPLEWAPPDAPALWTAALRIPRQGNYALRMACAEPQESTQAGTEPCTARLTLSGQTLLELPAGQPETVVSLARGDHGLRLEGPAGGVTLEMATMLPGVAPEWRALERRELTASDGQPRGFAGIIQVEGRPQERRQDNALATGRLSDMIVSENAPASARWVATLTTEIAGSYGFRLQFPRVGALRINGSPLLENSDPNGARLEGNIDLPAGEQLIEVEIQAPEGARNPLELAWLPPGGEWSILGPDGLTPAAPLVEPPLPDDALSYMQEEEIYFVVE